jgi:hypothetical protein
VEARRSRSYAPKGRNYAVHLLHNQIIRAHLAVVHSDCPASLDLLRFGVWLSVTARLPLKGAAALEDDLARLCSCVGCGVGNGVGWGSAPLDVQVSSILSSSEAALAFAFNLLKLPILLVTAELVGDGGVSGVG